MVADSKLFYSTYRYPSSDVPVVVYCPVQYEPVLEYRYRFYMYQPFVLDRTVRYAWIWMVGWFVPVEGLPERHPTVHTGLTTGNAPTILYPLYCYRTSLSTCSRKDIRSGKELSFIFRRPATSAVSGAGLPIQLDVHTVQFVP